MSFRTGQIWGGVAVGLALAFSACNDPFESPSSNPEFGVTCQLGCTEADPNPTAPGVFLTSAVTPGMCFSGEYTDRDSDGVGDRCENDLARAFAPVFRFTTMPTTWVGRATGRRIGFRIRTWSE